jgi:hypothetical protein
MSELTIVMAAIGGILVTGIFLALDDLYWRRVAGRKRQKARKRTPPKPLDLAANRRDAPTHCPYCRDDITTGGLKCPQCNAQVHGECWQENGNQCPSCGRSGPVRKVPS